MHGIRFVGFCGSGLSAINVTAGNNVKLAQSDSGLEILCRGAVIYLGMGDKH